MFKKKVDKSISKFDKIITWFIIWWALASIFWAASKTSTWKKTLAQWVNIFKRVSVFSLHICWKTALKVINIFKSKK